MFLTHGCTWDSFLFIHVWKKFHLRMRTEMTMKTEAAKHGLVIIRFVPSFHSFKSCILLSPPAPVLPLVFVFTVLLNVKLNWLNWTRNLNQLFFLFAAASYHRSTNPCQLWTPFASTKVTLKQHLSVSTSLCTMRVSCTVQSRCIHTGDMCQQLHWKTLASLLLQWFLILGFCPIIL